MSVREYIGARYVPLFADPLEWDNTKTYEPLTIVYYQGNSYTSRQAVPTGIAITNETYWALTGNYNAQIEAYRAEVQEFADDIGDLSAALPLTAFDENDTVNDHLETIEANGWVTTSRIQDDAVTSDKIADNAVGTSNISDEAVTYAKLDDDIKDDINALPLGAWGASETGYNSGKWAILYSPRPDTVYKIATPDLNFQDACTCHEINGRFYVFGNNSYFISDNLKNWTQYSYNNVNPNGNYTIYAPTFMTSPLGDFMFWEYFNSLGNCEIWYSTVEIADDGTLSYGAKTKLTQFGSGNFIDFTCIYKEGVGYIAAVRNETETTVNVYNGQDFRNTMNLVSSNSVVTGVEAPTIVDAGESVYMIMNANSFLVKTLNNVIAHNNEAFNVIAEIWTSVVGFRTTYYVNPIKSDIRAYRHIGLAKCTVNSYRCVKALQSIENETRIGFPSNQISLSFNVTGSLNATDIIAIPNFENMKIVLSGASKGILVPVNTSGKVVTVPILSNTADTTTLKARIGYSAFDQALPAIGYGRRSEVTIDDQGHMYL